MCLFSFSLHGNNKRRWGVLAHPNPLFPKHTRQLSGHRTAISRQYGPIPHRIGVWTIRDEDKHEMKAQSLGGCALMGDAGGCADDNTMVAHSRDFRSRSMALGSAGAKASFSFTTTGSRAQESSKACARSANGGPEGPGAAAVG